MPFDNTGTYVTREAVHRPGAVSSSGLVGVGGGGGAQEMTHPVSLALDEQYSRVFRERNQFILPPVRISDERIAPEDQILIGRVHAGPGGAPAPEAPSAEGPDARVRVVEEVIERRRPLEQLLSAGPGGATVLVEGEDGVGARQAPHEVHEALLEDIAAASVREDYLWRDGEDIEYAKALMTLK